MVYLFPQALSILLLPITLSFPLDARPASDNLIKRLDIPMVPSAMELAPHIINLPHSTCLFYTGGTLDAADNYANLNDLFLLGDADSDGWAGPSPDYPDEFGEDDYNPACPMSWAFQKPYSAAGVGWGQAERDQYFDNLSEAFARKCTGEILLVVPPDETVPKDSVFYRIEWPIILQSTAVTKMSTVILESGDEKSGVSLYPIRVLWETCETGLTTFG